MQVTLLPMPYGLNEMPVCLADHVPTEEVGLATDSLDFFLSPNETNSITSMLKLMAR